MSLLDSAVDIKELGQRNLWVLWGKSGSGKTRVLSTFPKPLLYIQIGDDGSNTIANVDGIKAIHIEHLTDLKNVAEDLTKKKNRGKYKTIAVDTFSLFVNEWIEENVTSKGKKMTQQDWGNLKIETEELIRLFHKVAKYHITVLTCHESMDTIEGMEDEITPDARPSVSKGSRTYLEGMANYGIHLTKISKETTTKSGEIKEVVKYAADVGANPYYWTKLQIDSSIKVPKRIINPTYDKFMNIVNGVIE